MDEAKFSLRGSNLSLGTIIYDGPITDSAAAIIIKQDPMLVDSLTKVAIGTKINITLSNKQQ